jgi:hypothetical protein
LSNPHLALERVLRAHADTLPAGSLQGGRFIDQRVEPIIDEVAAELGLERQKLLEHTLVDGVYGGGSIRSEVTRAKAEVSRRAKARYFMSRVEVARALGLDHTTLADAERAFP